MFFRLADPMAFLCLSWWFRKTTLQAFSAIGPGGGKQKASASYFARQNKIRAEIELA